MYRGGKIIGLVGSFEDVTEEYGQRKRAERLQEMINNVPTGISIYRKEKGEFRCIAANQYLLNFYQNTHAEISGRSFMDIFPSMEPEDRDRFLKDRERFLREKTALDGSYRVRRKDESRAYWIRILGNYAETPEETMIYVTHTDVTDLKLAEKNAAQNREMYADAVNAARLIVWHYVIPEHRVLILASAESAAAAERYGLPLLNENVPEFYRQFLDENNYDKVAALYQAADRGEASGCDIRLVSKNDNIHYAHLGFSTFEYDDDGKPVSAFGVGFSISGQKRQEELYRRELERLNEQSGSEIIAKGQYDLSGNRVVSYIANTPKALSYSSRSRYDAVIHQMSMLAVNPEDGEKLMHMLSRKSLIEQYENGEQTFEMKYTRRNGNEIVPVETIARTFALEENKIECFIVTYDRTRKQLERQIITNLPQLGYEYLGIVDTASEKILYYTDGTSFVESTAEKPITYQGLLQRTLSFSGSEEDTAGTLRDLALPGILARLAQSGACEYTFRCLSGEQTDAAAYKRIQFCRLSDDSRMIFMAQSDVTRQMQHDEEQMEALQKALNAAERANESKSMFLAGVSHDMRTPLNGIIGFTDFALRAEDPEKKQDYLEKIRLSSALLLGIINDTLELSRIESGKVSLEPEIVKSSDLIDSILTGIRINAAAKKEAFTAGNSVDFPKYLRLDKLKTEEICLNLLSNAVKYTQEGGRVEFYASYHPEAADGRTLQFTVEDNGIGMSDEFQKKMFEPFSQEHAPEAGRVVGTGLGLSIVRRYVDLMNGTIEVRSRKGKGTRIVVSIPAQEVTYAERQKTVVPERPADLRGKRILLCEDNYLNTEIAVTLLKEKKIEAVTAENGQKGLALFMASKPGYFDAVLMDLRMPVMDGYEAARKIRALPRPDAQKIPIIAMTADAYEEDIRRCLEAGMNAHIAKPFDPRTFYEVLAEETGKEQ